MRSSSVRRPRWPLNSPQARKAIADSENKLRDTLWPDAPDRLWAHKASGGFVTTPKTMPYVCRILDEMSKDHPLGPTYEALWSYTWGNNAFLRFNKPDEVAYAAGLAIFVSPDYAQAGLWTPGPRVSAQRSLVEEDRP